MINVARTTGSDQHFLSLVTMLDRELLERYPDIQHLYEKHAKIDFVERVVLVYLDSIPVACGCFLNHDTQLIEIKRMFVHPAYRGRGLAKTILTELEQWAREMGYTISILETGKKQPEAIGLYQKSGYTLTSKFGPYVDLQDSLCFIKHIA